MDMANNTNSTDQAGPLKVSILELGVFWIIWFLYCTSGDWSFNRVLRTLAVIQGWTRFLVSLLLVRKPDLVTGLFMTYVLGRFHFEADIVGHVQKGLVVIWLIIDLVAGFGLSWALRLAVVVYEALLVIGLLVKLMTMTLVLQERGRRRWLLKLGTIILWSLGWGCLSILFWLKQISQFALIAWFMTYAALFPVNVLATSPGNTPPPMPLQSPWLNAIYRRRTTRDDRSPGAFSFGHR